MDRSETLHLLGIPAEIRLYVLELAVLHEMTDGVITPSRKYSKRKYQTIMLSEKDENDLPYRIDINSDGSPYNHSGELFRTDEHENQRLSAYMGSATNQSRHVCDLECLLQPPITMVNRQLRQEGLPLFYQTNHFHIEMRNFVEKSELHICLCKVMKSLADWWRAIGDVNINSIGRLSFGSRDTYYELRKSKGEIHETHYGTICHNKQIRVLDDNAVFDFPDCIGKNDPKAVATLRVKAGRKRGIHVGVLEGTVAWQDSHIASHLENCKLFEVQKNLWR